MRIIPPPENKSAREQSPQSEASRATQGAREGGVTARVVVFSLILSVVFGYILPVVDLKFSNTFLGATHLPPGAVAVLLLLVLVVNPLLRLLSKRFAFSRNEVLTVYISCLFSSLVPGHGAENFFVANTIAPFYFANAENGWMKFLTDLPSWFTPALRNGSYDAAGRHLVDWWYLTLPSGKTIPWAAWLVPLGAWSAVILASYFMLACLSVILRAQWSDREALAYPLLQIPLAVTEEKVSAGASRGTRNSGVLFGNPLAWLGAGCAALAQLLNGLHLYFPDVPAMPLELPMSKILSEAPWNQIGEMNVIIYPVVVGITFLLSSEIALSLWSFYWFIKAQYLVGYTFGFPLGTLPKATALAVPAFATYQRVGAYVMFAALVLWTAREHLGHVWRRALGREKARAGEELEPLSYPVAVWGFGLSLAFILLWSCAAGIRFGVAFYLWGSYLIFAICLSRVVAEGGLLFVQHGLRPLGVVSQLWGSGSGAWLDPASIVPASFVQHALMYDVRGFIMPSFVQSFKLARDRKISARPLLALIGAVTLISFAMGVWMRVRMGYENGGLGLNDWGATAGARLPARNAKDFLDGAQYQSFSNWLWIGAGALLVWLITLARAQWAWFPLHPIGYLTSVTYALDMLWFSIALGWLCKVVVMRFGGINVYRKIIPFFLGLALGDIAMMVFWVAIDGWQGRMNHQLMPG